MKNSLPITPALVAAIAIGSLALAPTAASDERLPVSPLEAGHLAEIHTGDVVDFVRVTEQDARKVYIVGTARGSRLSRVTIDATHGRLLSIDMTESGDWEDARRAYTWPGIRVVAHRGGALLGPPENTLPAIERAIEVHANLIEIDIRMTADGALVLMHDATVDRTTNGAGRVADLTLDEVRQLEIVHDGDEVIRVPTLAEALAAMRGRIDPDLDFKDGDVGLLLPAIHEFNLAAFCTMHASWERALQIAELEPSIRIRPTAEYPQQIPGMIRELRPAIVNLDWHAVTEEAVRLAHLGGCHAFVNCLESADTDFCIEQAIAIGADYIQSDRPDRVLEIFAERGLRRSRSLLGDPLGTPLRSPQLGYPLR